MGATKYSFSKEHDLYPNLNSEGHTQTSGSTHKYYKVLGQIQHRKSVAKDPKMVAIVHSLPFIFG
jgi:hypothetical protein